MVKRKIYGILMLAVILPAILLSSFHHHHPVSDEHCFNCSNHIPHSHLSGVTQTDDCLVCQFLAVRWVLSAEERPDAPAVITKFVYGFSGIDSDAAKLISIPLRAPPFVSC
ncbi:MAG: hypothetical protein J6N54_09425 [Bacteroidales bacterium]|nr:hypothetical protein [Bacteroidales bacterium]